MSKRPTAAYGLAQMLASDPEMGTRIKAWMEANPDAMDRRKQRKLLRDLEAAEALLCAESPPEVEPPPEAEPEPVECAASEVGPVFRGPGHDVPRDGDEAIDGEIACEAETDGNVALEREVVSGPPAPEGRTCEKATTDAVRAWVGIKPMHRHAWVLSCAVMAWFEAVSRFAAMAVIGLAVALILFAHVLQFVAERNREAVVAHVVVARWGAGPMHGYAWALWVRVVVAWRLIVAVMAFARGPPGQALLGIVLRC